MTPLKQPQGYEQLLTTMVLNKVPNELKVTVNVFDTI